MILLVALVIALWSGTAAAQGQPDGQLTVAFDASIAPVFLDPAETPGIGTPFVFLYAMHDALAKPLPGNDMAPCLAESWKESADGLTYEFKLRPGLKFHNGDPFTAEDVKFTFQRYKGAAAKLLHDRVKSVDVLDPLRVRFALDKPWPDFLSFYATPSTGAAGKRFVGGERRRLRSPGGYLHGDGPPCAPPGGPAGPGDGTGSLTNGLRASSPRPGSSRGNWSLTSARALARSPGTWSEPEPRSSPWNCIPAGPRSCASGSPRSRWSRPTR